MTPAGNAQGNCHEKCLSCNSVTIYYEERVKPFENDLNFFFFLYNILSCQS